MPGKVLRRKTTPSSTGRDNPPARPDESVSGSSPERLRDRVFKALNKLSTEERASVRDRILSDLRKDGVNIRSALVALGIPAVTPDDLSPSDMAKLVRYVRINRPEALKALGGSLGELISPEAEKAGVEKPVTKAA
jgi:hypothetical protein